MQRDIGVISALHASAEDVFADRPQRERRTKRGGALRFGSSTSGLSLQEATNENERRKPMEKLGRSISTMANRAKARTNGADDDAKRQKPKTAKKWKKKINQISFEEASEVTLKDELTSQEAEGSHAIVPVESEDSVEDSGRVCRTTKELGVARAVMDDGYCSDELGTVQWVDDGTQKILEKSAPQSGAFRKHGESRSFHGLIPGTDAENPTPPQPCKQHTSGLQSKDASFVSLLSPSTSSVAQTVTHTASRIFKPFEPAAHSDSMMSIGSEVTKDSPRKQPFPSFSEITETLTPSALEESCDMSQTASVLTKPRRSRGLS